MRAPMGITSDEENVYVLCSDGTVWRMVADREYEKRPENGFGGGYMVSVNQRWEQVLHGPIPGTQAHEEAERKALHQRDGIPF